MRSRRSGVASPNSGFSDSHFVAIVKVVLFLLYVDLIQSVVV